MLYTTAKGIEEARQNLKSDPVICKCGREMKVKEKKWSDLREDRLHISVVCDFCGTELHSNVTQLPNRVEREAGYRRKSELVSPKSKAENTLTKVGTVNGRATMTKKQAKELGLKRFYTGVPCLYGHTADRYVSTGGCVECVAVSDARKYEKQKAAKKAKQKQPATEKVRKVTRMVVPKITEKKRKIRQEVRRETAREVAKRMGLPYYFDAKPCKKGHVARHFTYSGLCCQCVTGEK